MREFEKILGYKFNNKDLLENALTHSSYANEKKDSKICSNERLEFLGDAILGFLTAEHLYQKFGNLPEGDLTRIRAGLVCEQSLAGVAVRLNMGEYLRLGRGEESGGGKKRPSILADAVEAVLGAIYLDGGTESVKDCSIIKIIFEEAQVNKTTKINRDYKTLLQELVQQEKEQTLTYEVVSEQGPDHDKLFAVRVLLNGKSIGEGRGKNKKEAEQAAAGAALIQQQELISGSLIRARDGKG